MKISKTGAYVRCNTCSSQWHGTVYGVYLPCLQRYNTIPD